MSVYLEAYLLIFPRFLQPTKDRCLREGFADFLSKPLIISDLAKLLIRAYEEKQEKAGATPV